MFFLRDDNRRYHVLNPFGQKFDFINPIANLAKILSGISARIAGEGFVGSADERQQATAWNTLGAKLSETLKDVHAQTSILQGVTELVEQDD